MNDIEKAIQMMQTIKDHVQFGCIDGEINTAISALEKQIPKKPTPTEHNYFCPSCEEALGKKVNKGWELCCPHCGQAIDWTEPTPPNINTTNNK